MRRPSPRGSLRPPDCGCFRTGKDSMSTTPNPGKAGADSRIMATAATLFARFGYNGVSTREIAVDAGVNEVTIYRHYPKKRDLKLRGDLLAQIAGAIDARTALTHTFEMIASSLTERPELLRLLQYSSLELGEDITPMLRKHLGQLIEVLASYLQPWIASGELRASNARALLLTLIAIVLSHRPLRQIFQADLASHDVMFEAYAEFCVS